MGRRGNTCLFGSGRILPLAFAASMGNKQMPKPRLNKNVERLLCRDGEGPWRSGGSDCFGFGSVVLGHRAGVLSLVFIYRSID